MTTNKPEVVAVMYRDGGVLTKQECGIAFEACCKVEAPLIRLTDCETARAADKARIAELEGVLADATQEVEEWGAYASEYFQEKHDLAGTVARFRAALSRQGKEGEE